MHATIRNCRAIKKRVDRCHSGRGSANKEL